MTVEEQAWAKIEKQLRGALGCMAAAIAGWPFKGAAYRTTKLAQASFAIKDALEEAEWYARHTQAVEEFERDRIAHEQAAEVNGQP